MRKMIIPASFFIIYNSITTFILLFSKNGKALFSIFQKECTMTKHQIPPLIGGKTIEAWDTEWDARKGGLRQRHHELDGLLGLCRLTLNGQDMFIGTGIDIRQGIPKRLYDFHRPSPSGRNHHMGRLIYEHRDQLEVQVLITGEGRQAQRIARQLRAAMLERHKPLWNVKPDRRPPAKAKPKAEPPKPVLPAASTSHIKVPPSVSEAIMKRAA